VNTEQKEVHELKIVEEGTKQTELVVMLSNPAEDDFGKQIDMIDLNALQSVTGTVLAEANRIYEKRNPGMTIMKEIEMDYLFILAHLITGYSIDFFYNLPLKDCMKVKNALLIYLNS